MATTKISALTATASPGETAVYPVVDSTTTTKKITQANLRAVIYGTRDAISVTALNANGLITGSSGLTISSGTSALQAATCTTLVTSSNATVGGTLGVTGAATFASYVSAAGFRNAANTGTYYHFDTATGNNFMGASALNTIELYAGGALSQTWTSTLVTFAAGISAAGLPTSAGASGTLWVDTGASNVVKRVP